MRASASSIAVSYTHLVIMKGGVVVEEGRTEEILHNPSEEYTAELLSAVPGREGEPS